MKTAISILIISTFLFSCSKEKETTIVGYWEQTAVYLEESQGTFNWKIVNDPYAMRLTLTSNGTFSAVAREPLSGGRYTYNNSTKQLRLESSGNASTYIVSYLDDKFLITEYIGSDGTVFRKDKFFRK